MVCKYWLNVLVSFCSILFISHVISSKEDDFKSIRHNLAISSALLKRLSSNLNCSVSSLITTDSVKVNRYISITSWVFISHIF